MHASDAGLEHAAIKVLVVEDAPTVRLLLEYSLAADPRLRVVGSVETGEDALTFIAKEKPDVILMDIHLPGINGFETTRRIMQTSPVPIVICSAIDDPDDVVTTFKAMEAGALAVLAKPIAPGNPLYQPAMQHLVDTVRLMSEVKLERHWPSARPPPAMGSSSSPAQPVVRRASGAAEIVGIGTSTGGPPLLRTILSELPMDFPVPIVIVQHIARGFLQGLIEWLGQTCELPIHIGLHGERPLPGHIYFARDGFHLGLGPQGQFVLSDRTAEDTVCPSVGHLFKSLAEVHGAKTVAVLLTGMGSDGARELASLKQCGAITIAQDKNTSVAHGMPAEAVRLDGATYVLPGHEVAVALKRVVGGS